MKGGKRWLQRAVTALIVLLVAYFVSSNWHELTESLRVLSSLPLSAFATAILLVCLTFVLAAMSYRMLVFRCMPFRELLTVETAAAFINRLVPSGVGGLGVHGLYLHKRNHTAAQATATVSVNNLLGMLTHLTLLVGLLLCVGNTAQLKLAWSLRESLIVIGVALLIGLLFCVKKIRRAVVRFLRNLAVSLKCYRRQPRKVVFAGLALLGLTLTNLLILHVLASAVGISLELTKLFIVYSAGVLVGVAVPTPGGLAGVEAGLVAGFIAYGVSSELAIAATLAFRLATYWFPLLPGSIAFILARHERLV
jgi:uncharacterized protein (TIRG00374 family)